MPIWLLSVYDKKGIERFAAGLVELGRDIISSGGTAKALINAGVPARDVATITGHPPVLDHRVATLWGQLHGGLLADGPDLLGELGRLRWLEIEGVCVDLYPLEQAIANPNATPTSVRKDTDIGGPALLRSAAKGRRLVVCDPADRQPLIEWLHAGMPNEEHVRQMLGAKAEAVASARGLMASIFQSRGAISGSVVLDGLNIPTIIAQSISAKNR